MNFGGLITSVGEERAIFLLFFSCNNVVSVWRGFLFLLVLVIGCVILLWHSIIILSNQLFPLTLCEHVSTHKAETADQIRRVLWL